MAETDIQISSGFLKQLSRQVVTHSMPPRVAEEVCRILVACTHRFRKVREVALGYARQILETFSALLCDRQVVFTLLEILTLMRRSCEMQYTDEVGYMACNWTDNSIHQCTSSSRTRWTLRWN
jgi:phosphatidylinositol 4-kinase